MPCTAKDNLHVGRENPIFVPKGSSKNGVQGAIERPYVFGLFKHNEKLYTKIFPECAKKTIILEKILHLSVNFPLNNY